MTKAPPVFVISLARAEERRRAVIRELEAANVRYEIVDAVDGRDIRREDFAERLEQYHRPEGSCFRLNLGRRPGRRLSLSEIGCYLSHYNLWRRMADDNIPAAVILEDDARLRPGFAAAVAEAAACDWQWDLIYLHYTDSKKVFRELQPLGGGHSLVQLKGTLNKAAAYMLSLDGAKKLLPHCRLMHHGLDVVWKDYWNWGGRVYSIRPDPVWHENIPSTMTGDDSGRPDIVRRPPIHFLAARVFRKWKFSALKRWHQWRCHPRKKTSNSPPVYMESEVIVLSDKTPFALGRERAVYRHPHRADACLKVLLPEKVRTRKKPEPLFSWKDEISDPNWREWLGSRHAASLQCPMLERHLPACHGFVRTDLGDALCAELICDDSGEPSPSLGGAMGREGVTDSIDKAFAEMVECAMLPRNTFCMDHANNLICKTFADGSKRLFYAEWAHATHPGAVIPIVRRIRKTRKIARVRLAIELMRRRQTN